MLMMRTLPAPSSAICRAPACHRTRLQPLFAQQIHSSTPASAMSRRQWLAGGLLLAGMSSLPEAQAASLPTATDAQVLARRKQLGFRRAFDGRVSLQRASDKQWFDVKCDLRSSSTLLLREQGSGRVSALGFQEMAQIDLSDDDLVAAIMESVDWTRLAAFEDAGKPMVLSPEQFHATVTLLNPFPEQGMEFEQ